MPLQKLKKLCCFLAESLNDVASLIDSFNISKSRKLAEVHTAQIVGTGQVAELELSTSEDAQLAKQFLSGKQGAVEEVAGEISQWYLETSFLVSDYLLGE